MRAGISMADLIDFKLFITTNTNQAGKEQVIEQYIDKNENQIEVIANISRVNLFVGANNSGKSRLLREIFYNRTTRFADLTNFNSDEIDRALMSYRDEWDCKKIKEEFDQIDKESKFEIVEFILDKTTRNKNSNNQRIRRLVTDLLYILKSKVKPNDETDKKRVYIPTLRGVECFKQTIDSLHQSNQTLKMTATERNSLDAYINQIDNVYHQKICKNYFGNASNTKWEIYTGETLYQDVQKKLLGEKDEREKIKEFEMFLSEHFFDNKEISLIPNMTKKYLCINIDREKEDRELHNLGDGIKHLIVITYKMFIHKDEKTSFFIEEPELNLHPSLQRKMIEVMLSPIFYNQQFFITTHSNHLLDLTLDYDNISVYKFKKIKLNNENKVMFTRVRKGDNSLLQELGVKASSVFISNCTIWIEGITDRLFIRKYLELYQKHLSTKQPSYIPLKEDIDYSFVEYGGNNITHWNFGDDNNKEQINTRYLSKNIFLIEDNDFPKEGSQKDTRHKLFAETLGGEYYELPVREIENLVSVKVLKKIISDREGKINVSYVNDNITEDMYKEEHIGKFIDSIVNNGKKYALKGSEKLYDKVDFCHRALKNLETYDDLSKNAKELTEKVYAFIIKNKRN